MGKVDVINIKWLVWIFIILIAIQSAQVAGDCLFDTIQPNSVPHKHVNYHKIGRGRRDTDATRPTEHYQAIRISPQFHFGIELTESEKHALKKITARAVKKISTLFSVIPVHGPLILQRSACHSTWASGRNKGKCSRIKKGYRGEFCLDDFKIPDAHLEGAVVYNRTYPAPIQRVIRDGVGVNSADFILYVTSQTTHNCLEGKTSVIAYAAYCQLDQKDRPIAGHVNFCPLLLKPKYFDEEKSFIAALHEMFHTLGFSKDLFSKFGVCSASGNKCTPHPQPLRDIDEVTRLATPAVIEKSQDHFGCFSEDDYGGPIDTSVYEQELSQTKDAPVSSHWDSKFMQGSLMTAKNDLPHLTFIDPITLAVFEDTGWYRVNYSQADRYLWGKDSGCLFGLTEFCMIQTNYFCSGSSSGCHYLHLDRGICSTDSNLSPCKVVMASEGDACFTKEKTTPGNTSSEVISPASRCFMSNLTSHTAGQLDIKGRCYEHQCLGPNMLKVRVHNSDWLDCPPGSYIQFSSYRGGIFCPENPEIICSETYNSSTTDVTVSKHIESGVTVTMYTATTQIKYDNTNVTIEMTFESDDKELTWSEDVKSRFEQAVIHLVVELTRVSASRIHHIGSYFKHGEATVTFLVVGAGDLRNETVAETVSHKLEEALMTNYQSVKVPESGQSKMFHLQGVSRKYSTWFSESKNEKASHPEMKPEVIVGILLAVVSVITLLTIITMVVRRKKSLSVTSSGEDPPDSEQPLVGASPSNRVEPSVSGQTDRLAQIPEDDVILTVESHTQPTSYQSEEILESVSEV